MSAPVPRVALVTGASSGVGRAIALALAGPGTRLCLAGRDPGRLEETADEARRHGAEASGYRADLEREEDVRGLAAAVLRDAGGVDILVHSAGVIALGTVEDAPVEELDRHYRINLRAPYVLTRELLITLRGRRGQVVFVNSSVAVASRGGVGTYAASKHGLKALADSLRCEENPRGVRVFSVFLGRTATAMQALLHEVEGRAYRPEALLQPEQVAEMVVRTLGLAPTAEVTDLHIRPAIKGG
ncbi:MAG TPA: SDR family NAD(P)-dependent oxidoreductase [Candidatus Polarisedimenticolaceae bacterium]|nr:SDR family NAD(P)-dependent oxidoreductase [Candidatus Polarisedimenticolaceae bacterium]